MSFNNVKAFVFGDIELLVDAAKTINENEIVVVAAGYAQPGTSATGQKAIGCAKHAADNSTGSVGDATVVVETSYPKSGGRRIFWLKNDTGGNAVDQTDVFVNPAYVKDATTVTTDSTSRSKAGTIAAYDATNDLVGVIFDQIS